jgi:uncharacterized protein YdeI (YjbR/CyaY-like superfamily)
MAVELPELLVADVSQWRAWLAQHHGDEPGVWLVLHKKGGAVTTLTYDDALDVALCFGWIDGQVGRRDEGSFRQRFTPRVKRSPWSQRNRDHIARLTALGAMEPAGIAAVEAAQADGRWDRAYPRQSEAVAPADLTAAIAASPRAQATYDRLNAVNRYALIYRLGSVQRADTRSRKIAQYVAMLERGETIHPQRPVAGSPVNADDIKPLTSGSTEA